MGLKNKQFDFIDIIGVFVSTSNEELGFNSYSLLSIVNLIFLEVGLVKNSSFLSKPSKYFCIVYVWFWNNDIWTISVKKVLFE